MFDYQGIEPLTLTANPFWRVPRSRLLILLRSPRPRASQAAAKTGEVMERVIYFDAQAIENSDISLFRKCGM